MKNQNDNTSIHFTTTLLTIFVVLKLTDNIDWSWWWVLSPLWIPIGLALLTIVLVGINNFITNITKLNQKQKHENNKRNNVATWNPFTDDNDSSISR
jgi:hypothetical protein